MLGCEFLAPFTKHLVSIKSSTFLAFWVNFACAHLHG